MGEEDKLEEVSKLNLMALKLPILSYLNYLNVGFGVAKFNSDKHYPTGAYLSASWKF